MSARGSRKTLYCKACGAKVGEITEGHVLPGTAHLCESCEQTRCANARAVNHLKAKPDLRRRVMGR